VELIAPSEAFAAPQRNLDGYTRGGSAGLLNYDLLALANYGAVRSSQYFQAGTEAGFNAGDWIVRSRQLFASQDGESQVTHQYAYAQRTFVDYRSVFQIGQINLASSMFAVGAIYGAQLFPEQALAMQAGSGASVEGIAQTQARVEVRQFGALIYSTVVPAGPFTLTGLPLINGNADLDVTVVEANGQQRRFAVPAASYNRAGLGAAQGFSFALGKLQNVAGTQAPWLATATNGWRLGQRANLASGVLLSQPYQALATGVDFVPLPGMNGSMRLLASNARGVGPGGQLGLSLGAALAQGWGVSLSATRQTAGYREISEAIQPQDPGLVARGRDQYTANVSWSDARLGGFSAGFARSSLFDGHKSQRFVAAWAQSFKYASVSFNLERDLGSTVASGNQFYVGINIPLGRRSVSTYASQSGKLTRFGARYSETVNPTLNYSVAAESDSDNRTVAANATVSVLPRYTQLSLGASTYGGQSSAFSASLRGGAVVHGEGMTLSPYPVNDTFGLLKVGDVPGVRVQTPEGPVWTDRWGRAVIASLPEYADARIEVTTKSLPRNVDITNGLHILGAGHGSVNRVDFGVVKVRRALLAARLADGMPVPKGAIVVDENDNFVTAVGDDGAVFVANGQISSRLLVYLPGGRQCRLDYSLPEKQDSMRYYERADAVCAISDKNG